MKVILIRPDMPDASADWPALPPVGYNLVIPGEREYDVSQADLIVDPSTLAVDHARLYLVPVKGAQ